jgi:homocitrate synthase NifV
MNFVEEVCLLAQKAGIDRIRFADTLGVMEPLSMAETISRLKSRLRIDLGVHTHNDFGMATANAVSALSAGADFVDVTVHGLGERSGNAALEEIVAYMVKRKNRREYSLTDLRPLSGFVAKVSNVPVPAKKPVVGKDIFTCESGLHIDGLIKAPETYEPYDPSEVCLERKLLIGKKAGRSALSHKLKDLGIGTAEPIPEALLAKIRVESARIRSDIPDERLLTLYQTLCEAPSH